MANTEKNGEWHDWVGELFEPVFGATIDDLVAHEEEPDNKPKVCQTKYEPPHGGKPSMWFPNRHDTNRPVQSQKRARSLKFRI